MTRSKTLALLCTTFALAAAPAAAAPPTDDGHGREWRQLPETTGLTWQQVASVCPQDGATPCAGTLAGRAFDRWTWGTQLQVIELFNRYLPENPSLPNGGRLTLEQPGVGGMGYWLTAQQFPFVPTFSFTMNGAPYLSSTNTSGWTATLDASGAAVVGAVGFGNSPVSIDGGFSVGVTASPTLLPSTPTGVWLWRPIGPDYTPPVITPQIAGQLGRAGWYVSDVSLAWSIDDPDAVQTGCEPATIAIDTAGARFDCQATSEGGSASASVTIARDATPPELTCGTHVFEVGQPLAQVTATVSDATSGPLVATVGAQADTRSAGIRSALLEGSDRAGNLTTRSCSYRVVVPLCHGRVPTVFGTGGSDTLTGTAGDDVIHGLAGNDRIDGGDGKDYVCGGDGNDDLSGGEGDDHLDGGLGSDSIRGDGGSDNCVSGEVRMSSCASFDAYGGGSGGSGSSNGSACGLGPELALAIAALARLRHARRNAAGATPRRAPRGAPSRTR